ncbi:MAG: hypothetical protein FWD64_10160 [Acidobacteriaceae bacterium]|nr:hypothetical protein [Acidobacteriaceae bacterium]
MTIASASLGAQILGRRTARQTSATHVERRTRIIEDTYSHSWELGGGGGYLRLRPGQLLQRNNQATWWITGTRYLGAHPQLGIVGDVRGSYGSAKTANNLTPGGSNIPFNPLIQQYSFMGGVNYRFYSRIRLAISVTATGGVSEGLFDNDTLQYPSKQLRLYQSGIRPVFSGGVNFDYNIYPNLAIRVTPTYVGNMFRLDPNDLDLSKGRGSLQNNRGFNAGIVYRFGRIK